MLEVKVCATSANLGLGFDCLGLAINIYNTFIFDKSNCFSYHGFDLKYANDNNLVKKAYEYTFKLAKKEVIPVKISFNGDIPIARGLGSSSSLIVAGVFAANYYLGNIFSKDELFQICVELEGHPDNVAPAIYGGFAASYKVDDCYKVINYPINSDFIFNIIIPPFEVKTSDARAVLPKVISYSDSIWNLSRIVHLPLALASGDIKLLKDILIDKLHEPYRCKLIPKYESIEVEVTENNSCLLISGSGSSLLVISKDDICLKNNPYPIYKVNVGCGVEIKEC